MTPDHSLFPLPSPRQLTAEQWPRTKPRVHGTLLSHSFFMQAVCYSTLRSLYF